jgi:hypothetical protein
MNIDATNQTTYAPNMMTKLLFILFFFGADNEMHQAKPALIEHTTLHILLLIVLLTTILFLSA